MLHRLQIPWLLEIKKEQSKYSDIHCKIQSRRIITQTILTACLILVYMYLDHSPVLRNKYTVLRLVLSDFSRRVEYLWRYLSAMKVYVYKKITMLVL